METEKTADTILNIIGLFHATADIKLLSQDDMKNLNKRVRDKDEATDVLSFPNLELNAGVLPDIQNYPLDIDDGKLFLGSIALCMEKIESQAKEFGHSIERETTYLLIHGILHLLGYDHENAQDKAKMREKEEEILTRLTPV